MSGEERVAIQNVVKTRQPKLVQIQADHDKVDEGVVTIDDDSAAPASKPVSTLNIGSSNGKVTTKSGLIVTKTVGSSKEGKTVITPVVTSPKRMKCSDCDFTCKLQVQMNRHKNVCVKDKPKDGQSPKVKKWKIKVLGEASTPAAKTGKSSAKNAKTPELLPNGKMKKPKKSPYTEPGKGHPCNDCGKEFRKESILKAHQEDVHQPGEFPKALKVQGFDLDAKRQLHLLSQLLLGLGHLFAGISHTDTSASSAGLLGSTSLLLLGLLGLKHLLALGLSLLHPLFLLLILLGLLFSLLFADFLFLFLLLLGQFLLLLSTNLLPLGLLFLQALQLFLLLASLLSPLIDVLSELLIQFGLLDASLCLGKSLISLLGGVGGGLFLIKLVVRHVDVMLSLTSLTDLCLSSSEDEKLLLRTS